MPELTIVSPHRDDVPFSLCICLSKWRSIPVRMNVITVFTVSVYAPHASRRDGNIDTLRSAVTWLRSTEDRFVFRLIDKRIKVDALDLLDAPLRLGISVNSVCDPKAHPPDSQSGVQTLSCQLRKYVSHNLVLAPLALGNHIDHVTARNATITSARPEKLAFYEDLPYATWTSDASLRHAVRTVESSTGVHLKPFIVRDRGYAHRKRRVISQYRSQITAGEAAVIARFALKYRGGERIWVPKQSRAWRALTVEPYA